MKAFAPCVRELRIGGDMLHGYAVRIERQGVGGEPPQRELVYALGENHAGVMRFVKTVLRLDGETVSVLAMLTQQEVETLNLRPFQVRRARKRRRSKETLTPAPD